MTAPATLGADGPARRRWVGYRDALRLHQVDINRLNVYPVPDGDTGTNMALTLEAVVSELEGVDPGAGVPEICKAIGHGSLMGARGNSGVILSQLLRGMSERMGAAGEAGVGPELLVEAITHAAELARRAVVRPVEGTILTVASAAAQGARRRREGSGSGLRRRGRGRPGEAADALAHTPEMLPVLARAGVVDAGGSGYLLLLDAFLLVLDGRPLPEPLRRRRTGPQRPQRQHAPGAVGRTDGGELHAAATSATRSCTCSPHPTTRSRPSRRCGPASATPSSSWAATGLWNCHIHTNDVGAAIEAGWTPDGRRDIRVTDLDEQVEEERWVRESGRARRGAQHEAAGPPPTTSVVAVVSGDGIGRIFRSLGVHHLVVGGQSMNPSTGRPAQGRRVRRLGRGGDPSQQHEHPARGRAGRLAQRQDGARRRNRLHRRGLCRPAGL